MSTSCPCIAMSCCCSFAYRFAPVYTDSLYLFQPLYSCFSLSLESLPLFWHSCIVYIKQTMMPICIILLPCLVCHVYFIAYQFEACLHCLTCLCIVLKSASRCKQHVPVTCPACIFLSVTPFGVCLICILFSFSCTL